MNRISKIAVPLAVTVLTLPFLSAVTHLNPDATPPDTKDQTEYVEEVRGVWMTNVDSAVLLSRQRIADSMDLLARNGFNVVFPVVWNKGFTQYKSDVMADKFGENYRIESIFRGRDPLEQLVIEAHRVGIEVMPWFEFGFSSSFSQSGGHVIGMHPDWAGRDNEGNLLVKNGFDWMSGINPAVQEFINSLIFEVIENYDIDGVQGDDRLPAMPVEGGYDDYTRALYADEHDGAAPPNNYRDSDWITWRARKLTDYAEDLYNRVKEHDSTLVVSFSPSPYAWGLHEYLQNVPQWLERGVVDMLHPQLYRNNVPDYRTMLRGMFGPNPDIPGGYAGRYKHLTTPGVLIKAGSHFADYNYMRRVIASNREFGAKGEVFFFYDGLAERNHFMADSLGAGPYARPAVLPVRNGQLRRPPGVIVKNNDPGAVQTGAWQPDFNTTGYDGFTLRAEMASNAAMTWNMTVPATAWYRLYAFIPRNLPATGEAHYTIWHGDGADSTLVQIDQSERNEEGWIKLGSFPLDEGLRPVVRLSAGKAGDGRRSYADAMMLLIDRRKSPEVPFDVTIVHADEPEFSDVPGAVRLKPNYPNPFNPSTTLTFELDRASLTTLDIYDLLGRHVAQLTNEWMPEGRHEVTWDASDHASGIYLVRLSAGSEVQSIKTMLVK